MIEARDIHKTYSDGRRKLDVLRGVSVSVGENSFVSLVGPSGAGKSTLLNILGGLDAPSSGSVLFGSRDIYSLPDAELASIRNRQIGFIFQFYHLLPEFTVLENVLMPPLIRGDRSAQTRENALSFLARAGLSERLKHFPSQLSGGEQQRVAIVRALMNDPEVLYCDEPTGNLDTETGRGILALIEQVRARTRMSVVLVTHNEELAARADRIYRLRDGMLV